MAGTNVNTQMVMNYEKFEEHAQKIANLNNDMDQELKNVKDKINSLEGRYESKEASTIRQKITGMQPRFDAYKQVVDSYVAFIRNAATQARNEASALNNNASQFK